MWSMWSEVWLSYLTYSWPQSPTLAIVPSKQYFKHSRFSAASCKEIQISLINIALALKIFITQGTAIGKIPSHHS